MQMFCFSKFSWFHKIVINVLCDYAQVLIPSVVAEEQTFNSKAGFGFLCKDRSIM